MKLDFFHAGEQNEIADQASSFGVLSETDRLTDVLLCRPMFLEAVPCCSVTRENLRNGFAPSVATAMAQHDELRRALERVGVQCHFVAPDAAMPDMCFTRDAVVTTPWGLLGLRPAEQHRRAEAQHAVTALRALGVPMAASISLGNIEGGDIAIVRDGLVLIGCSGERTNLAGTEAVAAIFRDKGWDVLIYRFDPHFLHLDTQFAMVGPDLALACTDVLSDEFLATLVSREIETIPVSYKEARNLGCNILSLGDRRLLASADNRRVNALLEQRGFDVQTVDIDQFTRCGGGVHCLTMPLRRVAGR